MMFKSRRLPKKVLLQFTLIVCILAGLLSPPLKSVLNAENDQQKEEIINLIVKHHVSGIEKSELDTKNIDTILQSLDDPYTQFFTPEEWKQFMDSLENNYVGIGIRVGMDDHGFYVNEVFQDSPAIHAGMESGDYIVAVDGKSTEGLTTDELVSQITGVEGTDVQITVKRDTKSIKLTMPRQAIHVPALSSRLFDNGTGYIQVTSFSSDADELFEAELERMQDAGLNSLILDLRNNPGGLLDTAANMASLFIKEGSLIHTVDRTREATEYPISGDNLFNVPITILVNQYSASASEVLSGALQDYKLAKVIGTKTFGKGSVQSLYSLPSGGVLKLTIQEYLTPLKHKVNKVGITPNVNVLGHVTQLITALQQASPIDIEVTLTQRELIINGQSFNDRFHVVRENNKTYVPSRLLAAIVDENITWDASARRVLIEGQVDVTAFQAGGQGMQFIDGVSYIELDHFEEQFSEFAWKDLNGQLKLFEKEQ